MPRPKQATSTGTIPKTAPTNLSDESSDDIGNEIELPKPTQSRPKKNGASVSTSKPTGTKDRKVAVSNASKGKGKERVDLGLAEDAMEVDTVADKPLKRPNSALGRTSKDGEAALVEENERLRRTIQQLSEQNDQLQELVDGILKQQQPTKREQRLQEEIEALNRLVERGRNLLELRQTEFTKSKLINADPDSAIEYVTLEYAEAMRNEAAEEYANENEELRQRVAALEDALSKERNESHEAKRQLASVQRELDAEVEHSKKLQSDFSSRRPAPAPTSAARGGATHGAVARELEKKIELLEGLSGVGILNYTESIRQPGNSRSITYTCMLSIDERAFPFKLVVWDAKLDEAEESEHVVYSPGDPIDPDLQLDYLSTTFTFPRSQLAVFYQNMVGIVVGPGQEDDE